MKPLRDLMLVEIEPEEEKRSSGLYVKEAWAKPRNTAKVLEIGPDVKTVQKDATIVINPYAVIDTEKREVKLIKERDVLCQILADQEEA